MNKSLLKAVAERVREEPLLFDMTKWGDVNVCETTRCICGTAVALAEGGYNRRFESYSAHGKRVLGLTDVQASRLFYSAAWPNPFRTRFVHARTQIEAAEVAYDRILHFIRTGE